MKQFVKYFFRILVLLIIALVVFYFWASSSTLDEKEYAKIITVDEFSTPKNDSIFSIATYNIGCLLYTSPSPRDRTRSRMPSSA